MHVEDEHLSQPLNDPLLSFDTMLNKHILQIPMGTRHAGIENPKEKSLGIFAPIWICQLEHVKNFK